MPRVGPGAQTLVSRSRGGSGLSQSGALRMLMLKLRPGSYGVARFPLLLSLALASLALGACAPGVDTAAAGSTSSTLAISGTPATSVVAGQSYSFVPSTTNPGGMKLAFSISNKPSWATFSASTGELLGTPADTDVGTYPNIEISVDDGPSSVALAVFGLAVTAPATTAGAPPTISGSPATSVVGGQSYSFTPTTTDPSGGTLTFSVTNQPSWAAFSTATGQLSGTPASTNVGAYSNILISVSDGTSSAALPAFGITVTAGTPAPSSPPTISGSPETSVVAGQHYSFIPTTTDPSAKPLTFSISNQPVWATFSATTGQLSGTPAAANVGTYSNIVISVSDGTSSAVLPAFTIAVAAPPPMPPTISGSPATSVVAGRSYSFTPTTTDPSGKTLTFSISNKPSWATFNTSTGQLSGAPVAGNVGSYPNIVISVSDGTLGASLTAFSISVTAAPPPPPPPAAPPTISGSPATSVVAGQSYSFTPTTTDPSGKTLTFSISNKPSWATFSTSTGQLSGTPAAGNVGSYPNIAISVSDGTLGASLTAFSISVTAAPPPPPPPVAGSGPLVLYTDLISGPNSGGENNKGAYLSIFGKNFGSSGMGTTVKAFIGGVEVGGYRYLGPSKGRSDIQQLTVQVGPLGNPALGTALPIQVTVSGVASNTDQTFMVNPGRMLFVDNVAGNDSTAVAGDITHPFRHVQTSTLSQGAWGQAQPGDIIVLRGTGTAWTDVGYGNYFMRFRDKSGSAPTGAAGTGAIAVMGYPTEDAYIRGTLAAGQKGGCISAINGQSFPGMGQWAVISNLRIDCEGYDGPISQEIYGHHWRVINNDLAASTAPTSGSSVPRMAGITGNGTGSVWLGNHIHDIQGSSGECHGIYIDGDGSYEIAYNFIENIRSGNGFQIYVNGSNGSSVANNVNFHHNLIHDVSKHGINLADNTQNGIVVYDNVVYNVQYAGIRFNTTLLSGAKIYNNTFYATNLNGNTAYGLLTNDWNLAVGAARL